MNLDKPKPGPYAPNPCAPRACCTGHRVGCHNLASSRGFSDHVAGRFAITAASELPRHKAISGVCPYPRLAGSWLARSPSDLQRGRMHCIPGRAVVRISGSDAKAVGCDLLLPATSECLLHAVVGIAFETWNMRIMGAFNLTYVWPRVHLAACSPMYGRSLQPPDECIPMQHRCHVRIYVRSIASTKCSTRYVYSCDPTDALAANISSTRAQQLAAHSLQ